MNKPSLSINDIVRGTEGEVHMLRGRISAKRSFGKLTFLEIHNQSGRMQIALKKDELGDNYASMKKWSVGDIIDVKGSLFITNTGVMTLGVISGDRLAKCKESLPDKHKGVNTITGRENRGLALMIDDEMLNAFQIRNTLIREMRQYLFKQGFQEVDTGLLQKVTNTSLAADFKTYSNHFERDLYLRKTPELRLKQLLVGGLENIFEFGKNFRNEGVSKSYHPEFSVIELYQNGANYSDILELTINLFGHLNDSAHRPLNDPAEARQVHLYQFIGDETGLDARRASIDSLKSHISEENYRNHGNDEELHRAFYVYDVFRTLLKKYPEENIILHGVPKEISVLGKTFDDEPGLVEEFRYHINGNIICNGITELNDPDEQERRIRQQAKTHGKSLNDNDQQFLSLLRLGLPPCAGLGFGVDRTLMIYMGVDDIRDSIYFPL